MANVDSVIYHENLADAFFKVLTKYIPPPAKILDPAAGYRHFYKRLPGGSLDGNGYNFTFGDIRNLEGLNYVGDCRKLHFTDNSFDGIAFDPPYGNINEREVRKDAEILDRYSTISPPELEILFKEVNVEFARVLKPKGRLIVKIMDRHIKKKFHPFHIWCVDWLDRFELYDVIVYRYFIKRPKIAKLPYADKVHNYFMIFDKKEARRA